LLVPPCRVGHQPSGLRSSTFTVAPDPGGPFGEIPGRGGRRTWRASTDFGPTSGNWDRRPSGACRHADSGVVVHLERERGPARAPWRAGRVFGVRARRRRPRSALHPGPGTVGLAPSSSGADAAYTRRPRVRPPRRRRPGQCPGPRARELRRRTARGDAMEGLRK
jgi:hypothetical protein